MHQGPKLAENDYSPVDRAEVYKEIFEQAKNFKKNRSGTRGQAGGGTMLKYLTLIFTCQLIGEIITRLTRLPVPGPVIGMVLLFCGLVWQRKIPNELGEAGGLLLRYLPLLFVPAGIGVITYLDLLAKSWAPIAAAILIGTVLTIAVTGAVMQYLNRRQIPDTDEPRP